MDGYKYLKEGQNKFKLKTLKLDAAATVRQSRAKLSTTERATAASTPTCRETPSLTWLRTIVNIDYGYHKYLKEDQNKFKLKTLQLTLPSATV